MKTVAVPIGQLRLGAIIRHPFGRTLYHRVKALQAAKASGEVVVIVDGSRDFRVSSDDCVYVLTEERDDPESVTLDGITLG